MPLTLMSPAFADRETIPDEFTRYGRNLMPPLKWNGAPEGTRSYVLVVEDPDAPQGTFCHLAAFNIPADYEGLPKSVDTGPDTSIRYATNDFGNQRYDGPQPPAGHGPHHYHFRLAALAVPSLDTPADAGGKAIWQEARKRAIDEAEIVGIFEH